MPESIAQFTEQLDLQKALFIIGALIIVALIMNNLLRSRKLKKRMMSNLAQAMVQDQLEQPKNLIEPHFGDNSLQPVEPASSPDLPHNHSPNTPIGQASIINGVQETPENTDVSLEQGAYSNRMDPNIDCVVVLKFSLLIKGQELFEKMSQWPTRTPYRMAFEGLYESTDSQVWELLQADHDYRELQLSMQLANRRGPVSKDDLAEFLGLASQLAGDVDAEIDLPPIPQVLAQAQDLDHFAIQCDIQLAFNLVPNMMSWTTKEVETALIKMGLALSRDGLSFNYTTENYILFKAQIPGINFLTDDLQTQRVKNVIFSLDVPLVPQRLQAFTKMLEISKSIAQELDGKVLDDNSQNLEMSSIEIIVAQLEPIYLIMQERQIPPGSSLALRLFS